MTNNKHKPFPLALRHLSQKDKMLLIQQRSRYRASAREGVGVPCKRCGQFIVSETGVHLHQIRCSRYTEAELAYIRDEEVPSGWHDTPALRAPLPDGQVPQSVKRFAARFPPLERAPAPDPVNFPGHVRHVFQPSPEEIVALVQSILGMFKPE